MNALANEEVGKYLNDHFVCTFQKVGSFRIVNGQKQGGNVASYFCTADGGILDAVAGPVDAATLLREARWVVETRKMALLESHGDVARYKQFFRMAHVEQLPSSPAVASVNWSRMPFFPASPKTMTELLLQNPYARTLDKPGRVHLLLALYPLVKLDEAYKVIYSDIVGEDISTVPVVDGSTPSLRLPTQPSGGCGGGCGGGGGGNPLPAASFANTSALRGPYTASFLGGSPAPSLEERKERVRVAALRQACDHPAVTEVRSGTALNVILDDLLKRPTEPNTPGKSPRLDATVLAHINVIPRDGTGNYGLLRNGGELRWPLAWEDVALNEPSRELRQSVQSALRKALAQGKKGRPAAEVLNQLQRDLRSLHELLVEKLKDMTPSAYIEANEYLKSLEDAEKVLRRGDTDRYLTGEFALDPEKIHTVGDLVAFMNKRDLRFTAAVEGDESAYTVLHKALVVWDQSQESASSVSPLIAAPCDSPVVEAQPRRRVRGWPRRAIFLPAAGVSGHSQPVFRGRKEMADPARHVLLR